MICCAINILKSLKQCDLCLQPCPYWLIKQLTAANGYYKQFSVQTWRNVAYSVRDAKHREELKIEIKARINKIGVGEWLHSLLPVGVYATTWAPIGQEVMYAHGSQTSMPRELRLQAGVQYRLLPLFFLF